ncbi:hypothetical protein MGG_16492 [Pyricularia oryzae 70-15]|uniref:Chromo domain-containing protein n=2 Tax=Pyricularia oryzae TaxID=318829 RepID=G4MQG7_PYRO7|nr:uncharacterized protein MGG_16492 [Pyricularia oryzae 70-15]EHA58153.1 hypothetical protein MGG_16492 [Pyricularia oryzae 70-15]
MNTIDGAASYLGMDTRRNLTEDFRSATMEWESDLTWQLPARELDQLKRDENYFPMPTSKLFCFGGFDGKPLVSPQGHPQRRQCSIKKTTPFTFITSPNSSAGESTWSSQVERCSTSSTVPSSLKDSCILQNNNSLPEYAPVFEDSGCPGLWKSQSILPNAPSTGFDGGPPELIDPALAETPVAVFKFEPLNDPDSLNKGKNKVTVPSSQEIPIKASPNQLDRKPVALDATRDIWEVEELLAKWGPKRKSRYLVKWKGFPDEDNTWEPQAYISEDFIKSFESTFEGNHAGVQLLDKRKLGGNVEYLVEWKGRPKCERSWEKAKTLRFPTSRKTESPKLMHGAFLIPGAIISTPCGSPE